MKQKHYLQYSTTYNRFGMFADRLPESAGWHLVTSEPVDDFKATRFIHGMIEKYGHELKGVTIEMVVEAWGL